MTGNGNHTTYKNGDDWGMVYDCVVRSAVTIFLGGHTSHMFDGL